MDEQPYLEMPLHKLILNYCLKIRIFLLNLILSLKMGYSQSPTKCTVGLIVISVILMAAMLVISIVTLVHVTQLEKSTRNGTCPDPGPPRPGPDSSLNIPEAPEIGQTDTKYKTYAGYVKRLDKSLDLSKDPCNNFYEYSCANYKGPGAFMEIQIQNLIHIHKQITDKEYMAQPNLPKPVKDAGLFYGKCMSAKKDWAKEVGKGERLEAKMANLESVLSAKFPLLQPKGQAAESPDPTILATALAHLSRVEGVQTFIQIGIDTKWEIPHGDQPYIVTFDQASLSLPDQFYISLWDKIEAGILEKTVEKLMAYAEFKGIKVESKTVEEDAKAILALEVEIAKKLNRPESQRREYKKMYNIIKIENAHQITKRIKFDVLMDKLYPTVQDKKRIESILVMEPNSLENTMNFLYDKEKVKPRTFYNYLFYRLLAKNFDYLPQTPKNLNVFKKPAGILGQLLPRIPREMPRRPWPRPPSPFPSPIPDLGILHESMLKNAMPEGFNDNGDVEAMVECVAMNMALFPWANGRIFLDAKLPKQEERQKFRQNLGTIIAGVVDSFKGMLAQLDWMTPASKLESYKKIDNLITNIAWPELVENDQKLTEFHANLDIKETMSYTEMVDKLVEFSKSVEDKKLFTAKDINRLDFLASPSVVNAWYIPNFNSITFPLAILAAPFYHPDYPASINAGALGLVAGHELSHGFDDQGIQWDGTGVLNNWMDKQSQQGFEQMAKCVVDEYSQFEPVKGYHIDGTMTQGENIADNGGLRAAFRTYRTQIGLNGPDARLPDARLKKFTHDQLFFLSFGQIWCAQPKDEIPAIVQLLVDPHSPAKYRIFGSIQNFPAFRAAFNCPVGSAYGPEKHCQVWETESKPSN